MRTNPILRGLTTESALKFVDANEGHYHSRLWRLRLAAGGRFCCLTELGLLAQLEIERHHDEYRYRFAVFNQWFEQGAQRGLAAGFVEVGEAG